MLDESVQYRRLELALLCIFELAGFIHEQKPAIRN